ncbi:unnamed protein product [Pleuronectes platessa]|uniref:G-protein coupled receptors family 1 profile domain-containing protein n=1 Tax=Pleuronectes platessa TaxID=8262 RepID=A0A9N7YXS4_PLEPL|nr:unnamed protein product [Pleuronectes platessa]
MAPITDRGIEVPPIHVLNQSEVVNLIRDLDTDFSILGKNYVNVIQVSSHLFAMSSACYNPFIYASLHDKFLSYLCSHFLFWRRGYGNEQGQGSSILKMSKVPRLHTSTIVADLPCASNIVPQTTTLKNLLHLKFNMNVANRLFDR